MAKRIVFEAIKAKPYVAAHEIEFEWNKGLNVKQKQKNIAAVHASFLEKYPDKRILENSSKSTQDGGSELSAFNLQKFVPSLGKSIPVENVFQGSKVFESIADNPKNIPSLYTLPPLEAKREAAKHGRIVGFTFEGQEFPTEPKTAFYDYIYCNALFENPSLAKLLLSYDSFSDIEFNSERSLNCQARAAALFVSLNRRGDADKIKNFDSFIKLSEDA